MTVTYDRRRGRCTIQLEACDVCEQEECFDYVLTTLCRQFDCELIGRTYTVGGGVYQDFLSRQQWRWYSLAYHLVERLYYKKKVRLLSNPITPKMLADLGYKVDSESLRAMGARNHGGYITIRSEGVSHAVR